MSRKDRRAFNAMLKKVMPYAKELTAWGMKQPKMPVDPIQAAQFYESKTGRKPPVPYHLLHHFLLGPKSPRIPVHIHDPHANPLPSFQQKDSPDPITVKDPFKDE